MKDYDNKDNILNKTDGFWDIFSDSKLKNRIYKSDNKNHTDIKYSDIIDNGKNIIIIDKNMNYLENNYSFYQYFSHSYHTQKYKEITSAMNHAENWSTSITSDKYNILNTNVTPSTLPIVMDILSLIINTIFYFIIQYLIYSYCGNFNISLSIFILINLYIIYLINKNLLIKLIIILINLGILIYIYINRNKCITSELSKNKKYLVAVSFILILLEVVIYIYYGDIKGLYYKEPKYQDRFIKLLKDNNKISCVLFDYPSEDSVKYIVKLNNIAL